MTLWAGIDPGQDGGIVVIDTAGIVATLRMPPDPAGVREFLLQVCEGKPERIRATYIEKVSASGNMSTATAFKFGHDFGALCFAARGFALEFKSPAGWKLRFRLWLQPKKASIKKARELFDSHHKDLGHDGIAEAALLALCAKIDRA